MESILSLFDSKLLRRSTNRVEEAVLISEGNKRAFSRFYDREKSGLLYYLVQLVKNREVAEEIAQEVFLKLYRDRNKINPELSLKSWIYTVARNMAYDHFRKKKESLFLDNENNDEEDYRAPLDENAELLLIQKSERAQLQLAIESLPLSQREAISLWMEEMSYGQMGKSLNKSEQAAKNLVNRARQGIVDFLQNRDEGGTYEP